MNVTAIIQARTGSTRLPGKVLADVCGRSMLARVCDRVARTTRVDTIVVATSVDPADREVVAECLRLGVECFCGSPQDVLDRYRRAAEAHRADPIVRITADCPLIDPEVVDAVVEAFLTQRPDYAANILCRTWPRGLDTEVLSADTLLRAWREAAAPYQRIHVTPYIYQHPERFHLLPVTRKTPACETPMGEEDLGDCRWTVDLPEDLQFVRAVYRRLDNRDTFGWRNVQELLAREPAIADLNRHVRQKELAQG
ncbi:MAG: hypothetical protein A2V70_21240 [Planctomycetes bacterium RBG_13_63_9]|nr:MAG: hypothetical protein A2V70_21240 [Planctomycetes bacterium RBG_13_63_9]